MRVRSTLSAEIRDDLVNALILEQMQIAQEQGTPPMRPLFFDFPTDEQAAEIDDQFLFGPDLLVAPVLLEGALAAKSTCQLVPPGPMPGVDKF